MEDSDISKCRECGMLEVRKQDGYFPDGRSKRFVNAQGLQWNGRKCPGCQKTGSSSHIKQKRADAKSKSNA